MAGASLEGALRRDRAIVAGALAVVVALAWLYLIRLAAQMDMGGMDMDGMRMVPSGLDMAMASQRDPWSGVDVAMTLAMWSAMMVGMMTPSAAPMILIYARVGRHAAAAGKPFAATGWFAAGYLLAWCGFAVAATAAQWALERAAMLTPEMASASRTFGAAALVAAGLYQWSPLKDVCLSQCQSPLLFIQRHGGFRGDALGALRLGARHGVYCVGCCWALMALLFVGGVMNLLWVAALAIFALIEKIAPGGRVVSRLAGVGFIAAGVWLWFAGV